MSVFEPYNLPFAVALALMVLLAISQLIGLGDMLGDADLDMEADMDSPDAAGIGDGLFALLGIGRLPLLLWLSLFLLLFAASGTTLQALIATLTGGPVSPWIAGPVALLPALPLTGLIARPLGRILPHDETSAVSRDTLTGRRATITTGRATRGSPARARVLDRFDQPHHVMVEPHDEDGRFDEGEEVLLVRREGEVFFGVAVEARFLR